MDPQIEHFLTRVAQRYRSRFWAWSLSLLWLTIALAILAGWISVSSLRMESWQAAAWPIGLCFAALLVSWSASKGAYRDLRAMAQRVENAFPSLEQRLLTIAHASTDSSPFFRRRVTQELIRHARTFDWQHTLSPLRFWGAWGIQWLAFAGMLTAALLPMADDSNGLLGIGSAGEIAGDSDLWHVEPGDVELERGSDLFVTLRFPLQRDEQPRSIDAQLVVERADTRETISMSRALGDTIFGAALRRVEDSLTYRVEVPGRSSRTYRATVFEYPEMTRCDALIEPPAYARQPAKRIDDTRRVTVPEETRLTWICTLNKSVERAELVDEHDVATPMAPDPDNDSVYRVALTMNQSMKWKVRLSDREGRVAKIEEQLSARVLANKPAAIQLERPSDLRVSPLQEVDLRATLTDDYGIRKGGLTYSLSGRETTDIVLIDEPDIPSMSLKESLAHTIALEELKAQPDQLLSYFFWMEDIDRDGNPRRTESDMFFAEIRPFEELFRQGDNAAGQRQSQSNSASQSEGMAEELGELQKKIITGTWNTIRADAAQDRDLRRTSIETLIESQQQARVQSDALSQSLDTDESREVLNAVQQAMEDAGDRLRQSIEDSSTDSLRRAMQSERAAYEGLLKLRSREFEISQSQQAQSSNRSQSAGRRNRQQQIEQLTLDNDQNRYETENRPDSSDDSAQRETRQIMNRLDELARRQQDLNEQLRELDLALQEANTQEARKEIEEQLKRLRDSQQELLQDTDEVLDRMNREANQQRLQESRERMEQAREQLQQSSQAIQKQQPSSALASGSRAQQMMEETRESLREQSASGLQQNMRELIEQADSLERRQQQLEQRMPGHPTDDPTPRSDQEADAPNQNSILRPESTTETADSLAKDWQQQREEFEALLEKLKETVTESETSEPVLAEDLYETYREAQRERVSERLEQTSQLLQRGLDEPARTLADRAGEGIRQLRENIERSSESVLGSEQQSLHRAIRELDRARGALSPQGEPNENQQPAETEPSPADQTDPPRRSEPSDDQQRDGQQRDGQQRSGEQRANQQRAGNGRPLGPWNPEPSLAPLLGEEYQEWNDSIREVEELVRDPELKAEASRIREAAREMRIEYKRHSNLPQWPMVERMITQPMDQLRSRIAQELLRKTAEKNQIVPLDRDPVPRQFQEALDRYFERLGSESAKP